MSSRAERIKESQRNMPLGPLSFAHYQPLDFSVTGGSAPIVVLGAGIIGTTTALRIQLLSLASPQPRAVHILAREVIGESTANFATVRAGAHHLSFAADNDERQRSWDRRTLKHLLKEFDTIFEDESMGPTIGLHKLKQTEFYDGTEKHLKIFEEYPDFVVNPSSDLPPWATHSVSFTSVTIDPLLYLHRVCSLFHSLGGHMHKVANLPSLDHISSPEIRVLIGDVPPKAVVVCVGLGARDLIGCGPEPSNTDAVSTRVKPLGDPTVFPTRGQVVLVRAPWVRNGYTKQIGSLNGGEGGARTYVIPRQSGDVILGGTREVDDWESASREETTTDILRRALEICPELRPPRLEENVGPDGSRTPTPKPSTNLPLPCTDTDASKTEDPLDPICLSPIVVGSFVGFRPCRRDGIRLERGEDLDLRRLPLVKTQDTLEEDFGLGKLDINTSKDAETTKDVAQKLATDPELTRVVFNYGHGGAGWQSCWGTAEDAAKLVMED